MRLPGAKALVAGALLFLAALTVLFLHSLLIDENDWDVEAFLYLGSRLAHGELAYFRDFETKLPLVQYLFWIAHSFGGIGAWRLLTLLTVVVFASLGSRLLIRRWPENREDAHRYDRASIVFLASAFLILLYALPGAESAQLGMISAAAMYCAIGLCLSAGGGGSSPGLRMFGAGVLVGFASLARPNYIYAIVPLLVYWLLVLRWARQLTPRGGPVAATGMIAFCAGFGAIVVVVFLPYAFLENGFSVLASALKAIANYPTDEKFSRPLLLLQFNHRTFGFYFFLYGGLLLLVGNALVRPSERGSRGLILPHIVLVALSIAGLDFSHAKTHYWAHNSMMFVPYAVIVALCLCRGLFAPTVASGPGVPFMRRRIALAIMFFLGVGVLWNPGKYAFAKARALIARHNEINFAINHRGVDPALMKMAEQFKSRSLSFLVTSNTLYHRLLGEARIGDGHPAMLGAVLDGRRIGPVGNIGLYSKQVQQDPCLGILASGKDVIIVSKNNKQVDGPVLRCLARADSGYREIFAPTSPPSTLLPPEAELLEKTRFFMNKPALDRLVVPAKSAKVL